MFKKIIYRIPSIYLTFHPFKINEYKIMMKEANINENDIILDLGSGVGFQTSLIAHKCNKIIGIEPQKEEVAIANNRVKSNRQNNVDFKVGTLDDFKFPNNHFDKFLSFCVIEHIPNYIEILNEAYRIIKDNGQLIFSVDSLEIIENKSVIKQHKKEYYVENYFTKDTLYSNLAKIGFKNINIYSIWKSDYAKNLFLQGLENKFDYGKLKGIIQYFKLIFYEKHNKCKDSDRGLFLIVKCTK